MNDRHRFTNFSRRQQSFDFGGSYDGDIQNRRPVELSMRRLKSVDEKDFTDFEKLDLIERANISKDKNHKSVQIKLAAIYDDDQEIIQIITNETDMASVQRLLSKQDERGQPCIFYALESRSKNALTCLLLHVKNTECIIASNGESVLHVATKVGDVDIVKQLLTLDLVSHLVDHVDGANGRAPLHLAAKFNHIEIAKELLLNGAKLDREDVTGKTPIFMAASRGFASMLEVFLTHGGVSIENLMLDGRLYGKYYDNLLQVAVESADERTVNVCLDQDPDIVCKCLKGEIKHGQGGLIHSACKNGMEQCLLKIVDCMKNIENLHLNRKDRLGFTPIHKAAINNHGRLVKYLGSISKSFVNQTTEFSQTALLLAAERGHIDVVKELLALKADFRITDDGEKTVVHCAIGFPNVLKMLLQKVDLCQLLLNAKERDGYTPLHMAAFKGLSESINVLLEHGAEMNVFTNTSRSTLHCAVSSHCLEVVQLVLSNESALVNKADATGKTPLHTAANHGDIEIVRCLLDYGALVVRDGNMSSALHIAAHKGHLQVVQLLLEFNRSIINWENKYRRTALIAAASTGKSNVVKFLLENYAVITEDYKFFNCLDWCLIKNDKNTAMTMMCHPRWKEILVPTRHGSEGTMAKLVQKMPEVALRVLSNSVTSHGHPDTKEHLKCYDFLCLQNRLEVPDKPKYGKVKPLTAIKAMISSECYTCLCHPVCCKFLKAKWLQFGWKVHIFSLLLYIIFLVALNFYAFQIPTYKESQAKKDDDVSIKVKVAMVICLLFTSVNALKEIMQLIFYRYRYFLDTVNYLECAMYVCVFIFATPMDQSISVKTSLQWQACSVALLFAWINLVLYLRRFASYGIYILMMRKISVTLIKVLSLLIFFFFAFAAAFAPIMNDTPGFGNLGLSFLTSAVMTMGEFDFKETFLNGVSDQYEPFHWLRLLLLVVFIVLMPIILMNLLLALAIDDTSSIMQQAKLRKHIQMAKIIIDLERKKFLLPWAPRSRFVPTLEERPNKRVHLPTTMWEYLFYGPDFTSDEDTTTARDVSPTTNERLDRKFTAMMDMMGEVKDQMTGLQQEMAEMRNARSQQGSRGHESTEGIVSAKHRRNNWTQFRGENLSFGGNVLDESGASAHGKQNAWTQSRNDSLDRSVGANESPGSEPRKESPGSEPRKESPGSEPRKKSLGFEPSNKSRGSEPGDDVFTEEQDVRDEQDREEKECDPELIELKELHKKTPEDEEEGVGNEGDGEGEEEGIGTRLAKLFQRIDEVTGDDESKNMV